MPLQRQSCSCTLPDVVEALDEICMLIFCVICRIFHHQVTLVLRATSSIQQQYDSQAWHNQSYLRAAES